MWQEGGGGNLDLELPRDIIKGGGMGEHRFCIWRKRRVARKEGAPQVFRGLEKGSTQLMSPLENEEVLLLAKKVTVGSLNMGVGRVSVSEGMLRLTVEVFTFVVIPLVHGTGSSFEGR
jgi:hypothetical protein